MSGVSHEKVLKGLTTVCGFRQPIYDGPNSAVRKTLKGYQICRAFETF